MGYLERRIKNNITDKQKLIHTYITIVQDHNKSLKLSYNEIARMVKEDFNYDVTIDEVRLYFEPTIAEEELDMQLQMGNLGLK